MYNQRIILICFTWYFLFIFDFATTLESKSTDHSLNTLVDKNLKDDTSHEDVHSKNGPLLNTTSNTDEITESKKKTSNIKKTPANKIPEKHESVENLGKIHGNIATEGGTFSLSKTSISSNLDQNITKNEHNQKLDINHINNLTQKAFTSQYSTVSPLPEQNANSEKPKSKRIYGRTGVMNYEPESIPPRLNYSLSSTAITKNQKKPLFTMINSKEIDTSESFIESPTTGRDYVLPIVLIILALPVVGYIIKLIYRRGTEFTERQQYHRMYLIDGMYNSR